VVKDEGIGIPEEKLDIIFERFGQVDNSLSRQAEGSGIGLYLVKMFVERMGGTISVKSKPFQGTTFLVRLPDTAETVQDEENGDDENRQQEDHGHDEHRIFRHLFRKVAADLLQLLLFICVFIYNIVIISLLLLD